MGALGARPIKSAERTLALFELFSRQQQSFTVSRISQELNIPQASASMLLRNLTDLGYLRYDRTARTFSPSIRVALLGSWVDRQFSEAGAIGDRLDVLQRKVGETAFLGIQNGAAVQYVLTQSPENPDRLIVVSGQFRSLTCSAIGRVLLSLRTDADVAGWVRRCNADAAEARFRVRETEFLKLIEGVRAQGYAATEGDVTPGLGAIAVTFVDPMGELPMAVAVGGPIARMQEKRDTILVSLREFQAAFGEAAPRA